MHFLSSGTFQQSIVPASVANAIVRKARMVLRSALKPEYVGTFLGKTIPTFDKPVKMQEVISALEVFQTQKAGGFACVGYPTRASVLQKLTQGIRRADRLTFGIECTDDSVIKDIPHSHNGQCVVYQPGIDISSERLLVGSYSNGDPQSIGIHTFSLGFGRIVTGHLSSGTQHPTKDSKNCHTFVKIVGGQQSMSSQKPLFMGDVTAAFFDANFDATSQENLRILCQLSTTVPFSIYIPDVRVRKMRIANAPFENNQLHKGGKEKVAESMLMVCHNDISAAPSDTPLYRIREGRIHRFTHHAIEELDLSSIHFRILTALSDALLLDHQPIAIQLEGREIVFHNFMDFMGKRGFEVGWYQKEGKNSPFHEAQRDFIAYLSTIVPQST